MLIQSCILLVVLAAVQTVQSDRLLYKPKMIRVLPDLEYEYLKNMGPPIKKPPFCKKLDCPEYTVVESGKGYELREYTQTNWVTTTLAGVDYKEASKTMFHRLYDYITGKNEKKEKIAMTAPVLVRLIPGPGPACESNFTMSFYVSNKMKDPPKPSDPTVFLTPAPTFRAYVRQFSGYITKIEEWIGEAQELIKAIGDTSKYYTDFYFTAGYNSPFELFFRHNEIWFISK